MWTRTLAAGIAALILAAGAIAGLAPRTAGACSLATLGMDDAARLSDVVAIGELRTDGVNATLHVDRYFQGDVERAELPIDNREIELASDCGETPVPTPDHADGDVVAFLRETGDGTYRGISAGRGIFRADTQHAQSEMAMADAARAAFGQPTPPAGASDAAGDTEESSGPGLMWLAIIGSAGAGAGVAVVLGLRERRRDREQRDS